MPELEDFFGGVTQPAAWPHHIVGSYAFMDQLYIMSSSPRFAINRDEAQAFVLAVADKIAREANVDGGFELVD